MIYLIAVERTGVFAPLYSWLIRAVQFIHFRKFYRVTHVGLCYDYEVIEAVGGGVKRCELTDVVAHYARQKGVKLYKVPVKREYHFKGVNAWLRAEELVGQRYDWSGAINAGLDLLEMVMSLTPWKFKLAASNENWFCSEVVAHAFSCDNPSEETPADVCDWPFWDWSEASLLVKNKP